MLGLSNAVPGVWPNRLSKRSAGLSHKTPSSSYSQARSGYYECLDPVLMILGEIRKLLRRRTAAK